MNFLQETTKDIEESGHIPSDIIFMGSVKSGYACTWDEFIKLADFEYDSGYGGSYIARDIIVLFSDKQYMERREYDGAEWWDYCVPIVIPKILKKIEHLHMSCADYLEEMHDPENIEIENEMEDWGS